MDVLVACEYSGRVRDAFIRKGHRALSCDMLPSESDFGPHYQGDARDLLNEPWDLLIAHPPCTYLCVAGMQYLGDPPYGAARRTPPAVHGAARRRALVDGCMLFLDFLDADHIPSRCVENPIPSRHATAWIGKYSQIVEPYQFGDPYRKATCLWLRGLPLLKPTRIVNERASWSRENDADKANRAKNRAKTFQGIADAMAAQWG